MAVEGRGHGLLPDPKDHKDKWVDMAKMEMSAGKLESKYILVGNDGKYKPKVYAQGEPGTCTTNAAAAAYRYELQHQGKPDYLPSRLFLYYVARIPKTGAMKQREKLEEDNPDQAREMKEEITYAEYYAGIAAAPPKTELLEDTGSNIREVVRILSHLGAPPEQGKVLTNRVPGTWPYDGEAKATKKPGDDEDTFEKDAVPAQAPDKACYEAAHNHFSLRYLRSEIDARCWKACIASGYPVIFGFRAYPSFDKITKDKPIAPTPTDKDVIPDNNPIIGHSVLAVGWDDALHWGPGEDQKGCFRVQNSWGDDWADDGFYWMPYTWLTMDNPNKDDKQNSEKMIINPWTLMGSSDVF